MARDIHTRSQRPDDAIDRPLTIPADEAGGVRLMLCDQGDGDCNRLCTARHSDLASCDGVAGFDDRELFEGLLEPGHRSTLHRSSHLAARFALGLGHRPGVEPPLLPQRRRRDRPGRGARLTGRGL